MEGRRPSYEAGVDAPELRVQPLLGPDTPQQQIELSVVRTKLLAEAARDAGMKVSDDALLQYLNELGRRNVSPEKMREMLKNTQVGGARVSTDYVLDALREEMLAHNYRISHEFAVETVTPQQRWNDWKRVNDRVVIEAAAVPAEMYLADVKEPTEAELTAFFDKYKEREAVPDFNGSTELPSATPGFRIPRKIDVQFIQASYDDFLTKAEAKITDEEVAKYYEEHKDLFPKLNTGGLEEPGQKKDADKKEAPAAKPADTDKDKKPAEPAEKKTESAKKVESPPASTDGKPDAKSSDAKKSSSRTNPARSVFRLTAFAEDSEKDGKSEKAAEKSSDAPAAKSSAGEAKPATSSPAPPAGTPDASKSAPAGPAAPKKPAEYQPLSEVKDEIRKRLAEGKVAEELSKLIDGIQSGLDSEFKKWRYSDNQMDNLEKKELPAPPKSLTDFAAIAQKNGLKDGKTGPKNVLELRETPVGRSSAIDANRTLLSLLFQGRDLEMYEPVKTVDIDGNRFIAMKIGDTPGKVPTLAEVKEEVVKTWKKQQAEELAKKHAEEFAKKAEEAKTPLASFFADNKSIKVIRTDPFSELTGGEASFAGGQMQQQPYRFSQPSDIVAPGPDFLRGVFNLKDGQVGILQNNDHSIAYVVRVVEHQPNLAGLRTAYMADAFTWQGERLMNQVHGQDVARELDGSIEASSNLKWDRDHDKSKNDQSDEG